MGMVLNVPEAGVDYLVYGDKTNVIKSYLEQQLAQIPAVFNEFGQRVYETLNQSYHWVTDQLTKYQIFNQLKQQNVHLGNNAFRELLSFEELQNANILMQRWVMAHPDVRYLYLENNIEGYPDTYVNVFGNDIGENDYNYRRVMDGVLQSDDEKWWFKVYNEDLMIGDRELEHREKVMILNTWKCIDWLIETCDFDFTTQSKKKINKDC
jgi:hypothetical protein